MPRNVSWKEIINPIEEEIKTQKELSNNSLLANCFFHDELIIFEPKIEGKVRKFDVSFKRWDFQPTKKEKIYIRKLIISVFGGYLNDQQVIRFSHKQVTDDLRNFELLFKFANDLNKTNLSLWGEEELSGFLVWSLYSSVSTTIRSEGTMGQLLSFLNRLHSVHFDYGVGLNVKFSKKQMHRILKQHVISEGLDFSEWKKGGSHQTVPLELAIIMLGYAVEVLEDDRTYFAQAIFEVFRTRLSERYEWFVSHYRDKSKASKERINNTLKEILIRFNEIAPKERRLKKVIELEPFIEMIRETPDGKSRGSVFNDHIVHVYECSYAAVVILTGFRYHEIKNMKADCLTEDKVGSVWLTTFIDKTNAGKKTRVVHPYLKRIVDLLNKLSWIDKSHSFRVEYQSQTGRKMSFNFVPTLFSRHFNVDSSSKNDSTRFMRSLNNSGSNFISQTANIWLRNVWDSASEEIDEKFKLKLERKIDTISSHAFRHTWVEYALLNFKGDVLRGISRNFGYSQQDMFRFLQNYIVGKYGEASKQDAERQAATVLVNQLFGDLIKKAQENPENDFSEDMLPEYFKGPMATKLALYIRKKVHDVHLVSPDEIFGYVEELVEDRFVRLSPHQYGYCLLFEDGRNKAACVDTKYDIQKSKNGAFHLCMKCPNILIYLPANQSYLEETLCTHSNIVNFAESDKNRFNFVVDPVELQASKSAIKMIEETGIQLVGD